MSQATPLRSGSRLAISPRTRRWRSYHCCAAARSGKLAQLTPGSGGGGEGSGGAINSAFAGDPDAGGSGVGSSGVPSLAPGSAGGVCGIVGSLQVRDRSGTEGGGADAGASPPPVVAPFAIAPLVASVPPAAVDGLTLDGLSLDELTLDRVGSDPPATRVTCPHADTNVAAPTSATRVLVRARRGPVNPASPLLACRAPSPWGRRDQRRHRRRGRTPRHALLSALR